MLNMGKLIVFYHISICLFVCLFEVFFKTQITELLL